MRPVPLLQTLERSPEVHEICLVEAGGAGSLTPLDPAWRKVTRVGSLPGRARQMNLGAARTVASWLLFLHGDCELDPSALGELREAVLRADALAFAFRLRFLESHPGLRLLEWGGRALSAIQPFALGDQGLCLARETFESLGRFPEVPILEDWLLFRRLRTRGRLRLLHSTLGTSGRRFLARGVLRQLYLNARILYLHAEGTELEVLRGMYEVAPGAPADVVSIPPPPIAPESIPDSGAGQRLKPGH